MTENDLHRTVVDAARVTGLWLDYHVYDSRRSNAGWPDLVLVGRPGRRFEGQAMFLELKDDRRAPSPDQRMWLAGLQATFRSSDVVVCLVRPADLDRILALIRNGVRGPQPAAVPTVPAGKGEGVGKRRPGAAGRRRRPRTAPRTDGGPPTLPAGVDV